LPGKNGRNSAIKTAYEKHPKTSSAVPTGAGHEHLCTPPIPFESFDKAKAFAKEVADLAFGLSSIGNWRQYLLPSNLQPSLPVIAVSSHEEGNTALVAAGACAVCSKTAWLPRRSAPLR
jgi:hypothetical protein